MPKFSKKSQSKLSTCDPRLQTLFDEVIKTFDCTIIEGSRTLMRQKELFAKGHTKTLKSKHVNEVSLAVDVVPYPDGYNSTNSSICYFAGYVMGIAEKMKIKLRWGGDFNCDNSIGGEWFDGAHFELVT